MFSFIARACLWVFILSNISGEGIAVKVEPKDAPWHVELFINFPISRVDNCGGTLIAPTKILTSANCVRKEPDYINIYVLRDIGADPVGMVKRIDDYPKYLANGYKYAVAMATLDRSVTGDITFYPIVWTEYPTVLQKGTRLQLVGEPLSIHRRALVYVEALSQEVCDNLPIIDSYWLLKDSVGCVQFQKQIDFNNLLFGSGIVTVEHRLVGVLVTGLMNHDKLGSVGVYIKTSFVNKWLFGFV